MELEYLKTLWMLRFVKLKNSEETAARFYEKMRLHCRDVFGENSDLDARLLRLVNEEKIHAKLAEELLGICLRNHPDIECPEDASL